MRLPAELRVFVYMAVLTGPSPLHLHNARERTVTSDTSTRAAYRHYANLTRPAHPINIALLFVSKLVYQEARAIFYKHNTFAVRLDTGIPTLQRLHQQTRSHISTIEVVIPPRSTPHCGDFEPLMMYGLRYCFNLRSLRIMFLSNSEEWLRYWLRVESYSETLKLEGFVLKYLPKVLRIVIARAGNGTARREVKGLREIRGFGDLGSTRIVLERDALER
jgi:hypothetical protein